MTPGQHAVFYVRGEVENRSSKPAKVKVTAALYDGDQRVKSAEGLAGLSPRPRSSTPSPARGRHGAARPAGLRPPRWWLPGSEAPFTLVLQEYPKDLSDFRLRGDDGAGGRGDGPSRREGCAMPTPEQARNLALRLHGLSGSAEILRKAAARELARYDPLDANELIGPPDLPGPLGLGARHPRALGLRDGAGAGGLADPLCGGAAAAGAGAVAALGGGPLRGGPRAPGAGRGRGGQGGREGLHPVAGAPQAAGARSRGIRTCSRGWPR